MMRASEPKDFDVQNPVIFFVPPSRVVLFFVVINDRSLSCSKVYRHLALNAGFDLDEPT